MIDTPQFPLAAIVGADTLKLALCLNAIDPGIGGVLIEGPRGMAKSTLARSVAALLPSGVFVTLPLGASEERITGTLDLSAALGEGRASFSPGVLAKADGGVLYVDEVNLLPDHLVDLLLDVAASGVNIVERDGISHRHPARFVLIGTMNPEEGELRPQLLDRFGFNVALNAQPTPVERAEIVRRRLAFDLAPVEFVAHWAQEQEALIQRCRLARERLATIVLDDHTVARITERCFTAAVDGMRADLVWLRAARAHAAWRGVKTITQADIDAVEDFTLRHRRRQKAALDAPPPPASSREPESEPLQEPPASEGQWGALPPQAAAIGQTRDEVDWPKKR
jgi:magnesium chelatase subunit I